jgi:hypothetical protein
MEASDTGYSGAPVAGAVLAALFFPYISLIAALLLQGSESDPRKLQQLRTWAWISGGWLVFGVVVTATFALVTLH